MGLRTRAEETGGFAIQFRSSDSRVSPLRRGISRARTNPLQFNGCDSVWAVKRQRL